MDQIIQKAYPMAKHQQCQVNIGRNISSKVKRIDRAAILNQFNQIYRATNLQEAFKLLEQFVSEWKPDYKKVMASL